MEGNKSGLNLDVSYINTQQLVRNIDECINDLQGQGQDDSLQTVLDDSTRENSSKSKSGSPDSTRQNSSSSKIDTTDSTRENSSISKSDAMDVSHSKLTIDSTVENIPKLKIDSSEDNNPVNSSTDNNFKSEISSSSNKNLPPRISVTRENLNNPADQTEIIHDNTDPMNNPSSEISFNNSDDRLKINHSCSTETTQTSQPSSVSGNSQGVRLSQRSSVSGNSQGVTLSQSLELFSPESKNSSSTTEISGYSSSKLDSQNVSIKNTVSEVSMVTDSSDREGIQNQNLCQSSILEQSLTCENLPCEDLPCEDKKFHMSEKNMCKRKTKLDDGEKMEEEEEEEEGRRKKRKLDNSSEEENQPIKPESLTEKQKLDISSEEENQPIKPESLTEKHVKPDNMEDNDVYNEEESYDNTQYEISYNLKQQPGQITGAWQDFDNKQPNFLKGCKWSPDGSCILTNSDDNSLRLFNMPSQIYTGEMDQVPEMRNVLKMKVGETIYDYCWYPLMNSSDPATCCLLSTSRSMPVHMWDAFTGELICSYRCFDQADELIAAHCVSFSPDGSKIYCGFNKTIRIFDVTRPGRDCQKRSTLDKNGGQPGIISCITHCPVDQSLYAAGSYSKTISLYYEPDGEEACQLRGHQGGVTHLMFSPDGTQLFSGGRKDSEILGWDLRNPGKVLLTLNRQVETNQRIYFDIDRSGRYLASGNQDGTVKIWDVLNTENDSRPEPVLTYQAHHDTVNGVSFHPSLPLLSTSSGQRHYPMLGDSDDSDDDDCVHVEDTTDNSLGLWWLG